MWIKRLVQLLSILIISAIITGYLYKYNNHTLIGDRIIGIAVLMLSFVLIPLFIVSRYKKSKLRDYIFPDKTTKNREEASKNE